LWARASGPIGRRKQEIDRCPAFAGRPAAVENTAEMAPTAPETGPHEQAADATGVRGYLVTPGWALAASGEAGVSKMLAILEAEMRVAMALTGTTKITNIHRDCLSET
jgi:hypothetical protein